MSSVYRVQHIKSVNKNWHKRVGRFHQVLLFLYLHVQISIFILLCFLSIQLFLLIFLPWALKSFVNPVKFEHMSIIYFICLTLAWCHVGVCMLECLCMYRCRWQFQLFTMRSCPVPPVSRHVWNLIGSCNPRHFPCTNCCFFFLLAPIRMIDETRCRGDG